MSFKGLNLTIDQCLDLIKEYLNKEIGEGNYNVLLEKKKRNFWQIRISLNDVPPALLRIYITPKGLTVDPNVGKNRDLSKRIADYINANSSKTGPKNYTLDGYTEKEFEEFIHTLGEYPWIDIEENQKQEGRNRLVLRGYGGFKLTVTYFKQSNKVLIQGKDTPLFFDVLNLLQKNLPSKMQAQTIGDTMGIFIPKEFPEKDIENELCYELGDSVWNELLIDAERKWLKTSQFLFKLELNIPEYFPLLAGPLKVVEGVIKRKILEKVRLERFRTFGDVFHEGKIKKSFRHQFPEQWIDHLEEGYAIYSKYRNNLMHNSGIMPYLINNRNEAEEIFIIIKQYLRKGERFLRSLDEEEG